ncbi:hypothetical protein L9F63_023209 [Diploptera punctata]|uniref:DUF4371 domain-containing protein n=1 Tax=Diploptera punctata TaxID=6984 RepID=A0AAD7ZJP0_DIPPU|nr:hypothetical protein L9F63_023209 [Diploptera punctata]
MNSVASLLKTPFCARLYDDKMKVKQLGRPMPKLNIVHRQHSAKVDRWRKFNSDIYKKNKWLCGCDQKNAFFCFPCLLFRGETSWSEVGVTDLAHLNNKIRKHEKSHDHMNNVISLAMLGKVKVQTTQLNLHREQSIAKHNEQVDKNRHVLNLFINCIRFCGAFELALKDRNESEGSENKGIYRELINFSVQLDNELKKHLQAFTSTSKTIQNDLLECMLEVYHDEVTKEINSVNYIAVIADDTTDISCQFQLIMILRYVIGAKPVERFWKFLNPKGRDECAISNCIIDELDSLIGNNPNKLMAQSYNGSRVISRGLNGVQKLIKENYQYANSIHCYAHDINLVMSKAGSINRQTQIFFSHLTGICTFFSNSSQMTQILDTIVQRRSPQASQIKWNFQSCGINTVYKYRKDLITVMETIENRNDITLQTIITQASSYKHLLNDENFIFWLSFFHKVMPNVEIIFSEFEERYPDPVKIQEHVHNFELSMQSVRDHVDDIIQEVKNELGNGEQLSVWQRVEDIAQEVKTELENANSEQLSVCQHVEGVAQEVKTELENTNEEQLAVRQHVDGITQDAKTELGNTNGEQLSVWQHVEDVAQEVKTELENTNGEQLSVWHHVDGITQDAKTELGNTNGEQLSVWQHVSDITQEVKIKLENTNGDELSVWQHVEDITQDVKTEVGNINEEQPLKRRRTEACSNDKKKQALEVCDSIILEIKSRFQFTAHLVAMRLFGVGEFEKYKQRFPYTYISEIVKQYPFIEERSLRSELQVLYSRPELELKKVSGAVPFLLLIIDNEMCDTFQETVKLLKLLITMPMSIPETEMCFSTLKRIKTFLKNTMEEKNLTALGMLSCEKTYINEIDNFNKKVIDVFASKKGHFMDFNYRVC